MLIDRKDASVTAADDAFPGTFEVVLSTADEDRDGEKLSQDTWKDLPSHIPFDIDHEMSVKGTVGSGVPSFDEHGRLIVKGTFSSLQSAQDVRTLIKEGHITKTSVAFQRDRTGVKDGKPEMRELLNGAFVAIPSNRSADILGAKAARGLKIGARNNSTDAKHMQAIHDHAAALGAACAAPAAGDDEDAQDGGADDDAEATKAAPTPSAAGQIALALDSLIDQLHGLDGLPLAVASLVNKADALSDKLLAALDVPDPDDNAADDPDAASKAASAEPTAEDIAIKARALQLGLSF